MTAGIFGKGRFNVVFFVFFILTRTLLQKFYRELQFKSKHEASNPLPNWLVKFPSTNFLNAVLVFQKGVFTSHESFSEIFTPQHLFYQVPEVKLYSSICNGYREMTTIFNSNETNFHFGHGLCCNCKSLQTSIIFNDGNQF